jgi:hypothetical protein
MGFIGRVCDQSPEKYAQKPIAGDIGNAPISFVM